MSPFARGILVVLEWKHADSIHFCAPRKRKRQLPHLLFQKIATSSGAARPSKSDKIQIFAILDSSNTTVVTVNITFVTILSSLSLLSSFPKHLHRTAQRQLKPLKMHLSKVLSSLTFVTVALAAVVGASTSGDPAEIKRHHVSRFDEEIPLPPVNPNEVNSKGELDPPPKINIQMLNTTLALNRIRGRLIQWRHDLNDIYTNFAHSSLSEDVAEDGEWVMQQHFHHMDLMVWAASKKTLSLFQDMCRCFEKALKAANGIGIGGNDTIAIDCIRETLLGRDDRSEPAVQNAPEVAKREEIVTAPPAVSQILKVMIAISKILTASGYDDRVQDRSCRYCNSRCLSGSTR